MKIRKSGNQARDASARGLHFDRHRDRVAVVLHAKNDGQLAQRGGVHRLPELAFARSAVAERDVGDLIALETDVLELAIIGKLGWPILRVLCEGWGRGSLSGLRMPRKIASAFGASHGLQNLRAGRRRLGHDVQRRDSSSAKASGVRRNWDRRPRPHPAETCRRA